MTVLDGIPFLPSPNHSTGRQGAKITDIVLHWMVGTLASTDATFAGSTRQVSAHFGIEGTKIHRYVADADTAWHCGDHAENIRSIGIEHSAAPGRDATPETIATSVAVVTALCRKYGIDPSHIYPHNKFYATQCPGTLPLAAIVTAVRTQLTTPTTPTPEVDMAALTDAEKIDLAKVFVNQLLITNLGSSGPNVAVALQHASALTSVNAAAVAAAVLAAIPAGSANFTLEELAKAINDDAARRLAS